MEKPEPALRYALMNEELLATFKSFCCGKEEWAVDLDEFLRDLALDQHQERFNATYLFFEEDEPVAFVAIANEVIPHKKNPWLPVLSPYNKIPTLLLARLAVDQKHQGRRIGETIIEQVIDWAETAVVAFRLVALHVDANNGRAQDLYERLGFVATPKVESGKRLMFYDLGKR